jgi:hypothetical protein
VGLDARAGALEPLAQHGPDAADARGIAARRLDLDERAQQLERVVIDGGRGGIVAHVMQRILTLCGAQRRYMLANNSESG